MRRAIVLSLLAGVAVILATLGPGSPVRNAAADQQRVVTINDLFSDVTTAAPAFGGMFYDEKGDLNVHLLDLAQRGAAEAAIAAVFGAERIPPDGIRVLPARYSFTDLRAWQDKALSLFAVSGVLSIGIDHNTNVLEVGVKDLRLSDEVRRALRNLDIPQEAIHIKQAEPIVLQPTLRDRVRPVQGGLNIDNQNCTLGFNARLGGAEGFITNSHCTINMGVVDGEDFYQTAIIAADRIGVETVDPPFFECPGLPGIPCRWSDAAFAQYIGGVNFARGFVEKTQGVNTPQLPGNVNIVGSFQITGTAFPVVGETVNKVGRSSGWTQGTVTNVCVDGITDTHIMLCQTTAGYQSAGGDSGSPVFKIPSPGSDNVTLVGIHWGGSGDAGECPGGCTDEGIPMTTSGVFSPLGNVAGELGALTVTGPAPAVGGIAAFPDVDAAGPRAAGSSGDSSFPYAALAGGLAAAVVAVAAGGWYVRRRWLG